MARKPAAVFLLSFILVAFLATAVVFGSDKPIKPFQDRASFPVRFAPVYGFAGAEQGAFTAPKGADLVALGQVSTNAVGTQVGTTTYDYQHNGSMGRQIEHRGTNFVHFDWMYQAGFVLGVGRGCAVQAYNLTDCNLEFTAPKLGTTDYGGYVNMDAAQNGCAIPAAHEGPDKDSQAPRTYFDFCATGPFGLFTADAPTDVWGWYHSNGTPNGNQNLWPIIDHQVGTEEVIHLVANESGGAAGDPATASYYRRVGGYGAAVGVWSPQIIIDTVQNINCVVAASPTTDKVAIVWTRPCSYLGRTDNTRWNQIENDVWYAISDKQGRDWVDSLLVPRTSIGHKILTNPGYWQGGNITNYVYNDTMHLYKAYCNVSALWSQPDNNLHVVWNARHWIDTTTLNRRSGAIFHWSQDHPTTRTVVKADWDTAGTCAGEVWGMDVDKMSISQCDGKLYVLYVQKGNADEPCYDYSANKKIMNGELYLTVSGDGGLNWDRAQNLTNSPSPLCADGNCEADQWPTMARYGRTEVCPPLTGQKVLDVLYINDKSPGSPVQPESGIWTINPVMYFRTPCRAEVPEPLYSDDAGPGYGEPFSDVPLRIAPGGDTTITLRMENTGLLGNNWSIATSPAVSWITAVPSSGTIPCCGGTFNVALTFSTPSGALDPSYYKDTIVVTHHAVGSPRKIRVGLIVASDFTYPQSAVLATACKRIKVWNTGELVKNAADAAMDYIDDCDTLNPQTTSNIYLYSGSPIVCRIKGLDTLRFMMYSRIFTDDDAFRPQSPLYVDSGDPAYSSAISEYWTADSAIAMSTEYIVPKDPNYQDFVVQITQFWNRTSVQLNSVLLGEFVDWDVPSDSGSRNSSGYDAALKLIWQRGAEYSDTLEGICGQKSDNRYAAIFVCDSTPLKNAMTIDNATYVYSSGLAGAPLPKGVTYKLMKDKSGFSRYEDRIPAPRTDSMKTDLSTLITFGEYNLPPYTSPNCSTITVVKYLYTTKSGTPIWADEKAKIHTWVQANLKKTAPALPDTTAIRLHNPDTSWTPEKPPVGQVWQELHPYNASLNKDTLTAWYDTAPGGTLSVGDSVQINHKAGKYRVVWVGPTIKLRLLFPDPDSLIYMDYVGFDNPLVSPIIHPRGTFWHEVYPRWCRLYWLQSWFDNGTSRLDFCDYVVLKRIFPAPWWCWWYRFSFYHVEGVYTDIIIKASTCCVKAGDANNDNAVNVGDAVTIINYIFKGGPVPPCKCQGDANGDGTINVGDAVSIINYVFKGGPAPVCNLANPICQ